MKKFLFGLILCLGVSGQALAQGHGFPYPNDPAGTTVNKLAKLTNNSGVISVALAGTSDEAVGIITDGAGTTGTASLATWGRILCTFDNTTVTGDYVQNVSGSCHDAGSTRPTSGQFIGRVSDTGGSAGNYKVLLGVGQFPSAAATITLCNSGGTTDTISAAGSFATTCSFGGLTVGTLLEVRAHGVYTTSATASPLYNMQVNAGGTTAICQHSANISIGTSKTNNAWDLVCWIRILTTGAPGTAAPYGTDEAAVAGTGNVTTDYYSPQPSATLGYTTTTNQTLSIQETATLVSGESFTLQGLTARNITAQ